MKTTARGARIGDGPQLEYSDRLHAMKYRPDGENFRECMNRCASAMADDEAHYHAFRDILLDQRYMPAGRIQLAMGSTRIVTPYNCFVSGAIEDSYVDGDGSIMARAIQAAKTMRSGGGIGYDFSRLRPRGELIKKLGSRSSGPVSFMEIYDAVCRCTASSGHRRGAQMGVMRVDHPDVEEFVRAKQNNDRLTGFNVSLAITDEFMRAVENDADFDLRWDGKTYRTIRARPLWETIMRSTWDWAEPGVLFVDRINDQNNLSYCEEIAATNPCGEQPLPPFGACLLGSLNLVRYLYWNGASWVLDHDAIREDVPHIVRAMDNVVDRATYPLFEQEREAKSKRRMGLGVTGVANAIEALGHPYGSAAFCAELERVLRTLRDEAYRASVELAREKGPFPLFREEYLDSPFVNRLPEEIVAGIEEHGIRNSHLTSIAPTGTISMCADNVSSGIEPVWAYRAERTLNTEAGVETWVVDDYGYAALGVKGKTSEDCTVEDHLRVLFAAVPYVDSAISKTCNLPGSTPWEDFKEIYFRAWRAGAKGCTTYNKDGERSGILKAIESDEGEGSEVLACRFDPETGTRTCDD